jgi:hypothetical protein
VALAFAVAGGQFVAGVGALLWSFAVSSDVFEGYPVSSFSRHLATPVQRALWFPLGSLHRWAPLKGIWGYGLIGANSLLWGVGLVYALSKIRQAASNKNVPSAGDAVKR